MLLNKKILVVVPARGGSKGVKLKNIRPLNGKPLLGYTADVIKQLPWIDRAVVSTDSDQIAKVASEYNLDVPFMRPQDISGDIIGDWDVLYHALNATEQDDGMVYDIVVMLQPTCPLRKPDHVMATVVKLIEGDYDAVWSVSETDSKCHPFKQFILNDDNLEYYDSRGSQVIARQQLNPVYHVNGASYVFTRQCLLQQKSKKGKKTSAVILKEHMISIDTLFDFEFTEWLIKKHGIL